MLNYKSMAIKYVEKPHGIKQSKRCVCVCERERRGKDWEKDTETKRKRKTDTETDKALYIFKIKILFKNSVVIEKKSQEELQKIRPVWNMFYKDRYTNVYRTFICYSQNMETTQMPSIWKKGETVMGLFKGIPTAIKMNKLLTKTTSQWISSVLFS